MPFSLGRLVGISASETVLASEDLGGDPLSAIVEKIAVVVDLVTAAGVHTEKPLTLLVARKRPAHTAAEDIDSFILIE